MNSRHSKATPRWGTSPEYVEMARVALGGRIELDPMSEPAFNKVVKADRIYTERDDGFSKPWTCETMLLNPAGGLVVEAWRRLIDEYAAGYVQRAIWIGFSVEQLNLLADHWVHPLDYSLLICRQRIDFLTLHPKRSVISTYGKHLGLECGHSQPRTAKSRKDRVVRCMTCIAEPEPNGAPSHGNYVVGIGIDQGLFERAFSGRGRFSHGRLAASARSVAA